MALEVSDIPVFAVDIAAKKLIQSCEEVLRASMAEGRGLNKQSAGIPLPEWDSEATPSSCQVYSGCLKL